METQNYRLNFVSLYLVFLLSLMSFCLMGQDTTLYDLSLEELWNVNVISASNREQKLTEAPATIYMITEEDIKQFGFEIYDALHFGHKLFLIKKEPNEPKQ